MSTIIDTLVTDRTYVFHPLAELVGVYVEVVE